MRILLAVVALLLPVVGRASPFVYVWNAGDSTVDSTITVVDLATDQIETTLEVGQGSINSAALSPDGQYLFVAKWSGAVYVYQINEVMHSLVFAQDIGGEPSDLAFTPDGTEVYVSHAHMGYITRLEVADWIVRDDPTTTADDVRPAYSFATIPLGGRRLAINDLGDTAVVAHDGGELSIIDLWAETSTTQTNGAQYPGGLALIPGSGLMVVTEPNLDRVRIVTPNHSGAVNHSVAEARGVLARYEGQTLKIQVAEAGADEVRTLGGWPSAGTGSRPFAVAWSESQGVLVTANYEDDSVSVLRPTRVDVAVPDTDRPTGIVVGPALPPVAARRESPIRFSYKLCQEKIAGKLELINRGPGLLRIGAVTLGGTDQKAYAIAKNACADRTLAPGASCVTTLTFTSVKEAGKQGVYDATVIAATNDPKAKLLVTQLLAKPAAKPCGVGY